MWRRVTLLPVPDGPISTVISPRGMRQVTPSRTRSDPKALCTSTSSMTGSLLQVESLWLAGRSPVCTAVRGGAGAAAGGGAGALTGFAVAAGGPVPLFSCAGAAGASTGALFGSVPAGAFGSRALMSELDRQVGVGTPEDLRQQR